MKRPLPDARGHFGRFGGRFVPETLMAPLIELEGAWRQELPEDLAAQIQTLRRVTTKPICVGFGISTPAQVAAIGRLADGAIVGSAVVRLVEERAGSPTLVEDVGKLIAELKEPLKTGLGDRPQPPPRRRAAPGGSRAAALHGATRLEA